MVTVTNVTVTTVTVVATPSVSTAIEGLNGAAGSAREATVEQHKGTAHRPLVHVADQFLRGRLRTASFRCRIL